MKFYLEQQTRNASDVFTFGADVQNTEMPSWKIEIHVTKLNETHLCWCKNSQDAVCNANGTKFN